MSLLRRRMLMAKKPSGGGDAPEFPLYLYFDYCEESSGYKTCYIKDNSALETYFDYLKSECLKYDNGSIYYDLPEESRIALGIEIYFDEELATDFYFDSSDEMIYFVTDPNGYGQWYGRTLAVDYEGV